MMKSIKRSIPGFLLVAGLLALLAGAPRTPQANAGGPLMVTTTGSPYFWRTLPIPYTPDRGTLGRLTNSQALTMVAEAFQPWQSVPTGRAQFRQDGQLSQDITDSNVMAFLDQITQDCLGGGACTSPIIFDTNGRITDALLGAGASRTIAGFAGPTVIGGGRILQARAVLNGRFSSSELKGIATHEFGHYIGLDHSQLNLALITDGNSGNDIAIPTMNPFFGPPPAREFETLHLDDMLAVSALYTNFSEFFTKRGQISGQILWPDGTGFQGANVVARKVDDPFLTASTSVSGFLHRGTRRGEDFGSDNPGQLGFYRIGGLPEGRYTVEIEELDPSFVQGSGVGPLDPPADLPAPPEFYSGDQESATDNPNSKVEIEVTPNSRIGDINIILNVPGMISQAETRNQKNQRRSQ